MRYLGLLLLGLAASSHSEAGHRSHLFPKDIQPDPEHPWIGTWESIDGRFESINTLSSEIRPYFEDASTTVFRQFWKDGDHFYHAIVVPERNFRTEFRFRLNEESGVSLNGTEYKFTYSEKGKDLHAIVKIPSTSTVFTDVYHIQNDEMLKTFTRGSVQAKRWFKKVTSMPS